MTTRLVSAWDRAWWYLFGTDDPSGDLPYEHAATVIAGLEEKIQQLEATCSCLKAKLDSQGLKFLETSIALTVEQERSVYLEAQLALRGAA